MKRNRRFDILVVVPDVSDISPLMDRLQETERTETHHVADGEAALDFVHRRDEYAHAPRPDLVLLDLQLPGGGGEEILSKLKEQPPFRRIPVIVLASSEAEEDIVRSYELHTNAYVPKPTAPEECDALARAIEEFWLGIVQLPPK